MEQEEFDPGTGVLVDLQFLSPGSPWAQAGVEEERLGAGAWGSAFLAASLDE